MRKTSIEIRLECERATFHKPRSVFLLRIEQVLHAALVRRIGCGQARGSQRKQRPACGVRTAAHRRQIGPAAIRPLRSQKILHAALDYLTV